MKKPIVIIVLCVTAAALITIAVLIGRNTAQNNASETDKTDTVATQPPASATDVNSELEAISSAAGSIMPVFSPVTSRINKNGTFTNPFIWADVPDPDVIRVGDAYYMTSTTMYFSPGCPIMKSYDLVNWETVGYVYDILEDSDELSLRNGKNAYGKGSWASSLRYNNGTFYVGFASLTTGKTYIYQTEDIENGPWRKNVIDGFYHDLSLLFDDDGRVYMVYGGGTIHIKELTSDASAIKPGGMDKIIIENANAGGEGGLPAEGSHIYKIDGKYYIFLIAWPSGGTNRRIQLCYRSDNIEGPYTGRVVLDDNLNYQNAGVAQGGIVETNENKWYAMLFQDHGAVGRIPVLTPVAWEDGWPVFGVDGKTPQVMDLPIAAQGESSIVVSDEFYSLASKWQWNHNPDNENWSLSVREGYLRLINGNISQSLTQARNTLTQRTFGPECSGTVSLDTVGMKSGDVAGLAALQAKYGYVAVKMDGVERYIVMVENKDGSEQEIERVLINQLTVFFKIDFNFKTDKAKFYYSLDGLSWVSIGNELSMTYDLAHFTGYRFALFNYAAKIEGGYADFDYFRVTDKISGDKNPTVLLNASLGEQQTVQGLSGVEFEIPVILDEMPENDCNGLYIAFMLPENLELSGVSFNDENITGTTGYGYESKFLQLYVTGENISVSHKNLNTFATIKLRVDGIIPDDTRINLKPLYIHTEGGNAAYKAFGVQTAITLARYDTGAAAKLPGYSNPLISHKFGADPYAIEYNGRVYVYLTSDAYEYDSDGNIKDNTFGNIKSITILSSEDMVNWTDHGAVTISGITGATSWANLSWAPAAVYKNIDGKDRFFLYFANGAGGIGVLTSDTPYGPWRDPIGKPLINWNTPGTEGVVWLFDPAVLIDDDGTGYIYYGGGLPGSTDEDALHPNTARVIQLGDDMISTVGSAVAIDAPAFFEDSGIHKYNGRYYYTYCANFSGPRPEGYPPHGEIAYMMADNPMGPFTYIGPVLKNPSHYFGVGGNNHHCFFEFNGQWYITYHAQTLNKANGLPGGGYRSPHINLVEYDENGYIKPVTADMKGVSLPAAINPYIKVEAETFAWNKGINTVNETDPGVFGATLNMLVTDISDGDWLCVANVDFDVKQPKKLTAQAIPVNGGCIEIRKDSPEGDIIGTLEIPQQEGKTGFTEFSCEVLNVTGQHNLYFMFKGDEDNLFDFDWWIFE